MMKIFYFLFFITTPFFMFNYAFAEEHNGALEINLEYLAILAGFSGIATFGWGIYQYRQVRLDKRKELFLEITKEFDTSKEFLPAKKILDGWTAAYSVEKGLQPSVTGQFSKNNIDWILSKGYKHRKDLENKYKEKYFQNLKSDDLDESWRLLRESFDALFDFYERLVYLQENKRITKKEMAYFEYYLELAKEDKNVISFLETYKFSWHKDLKYDKK